jgi:hypothetical protein
MPQASILHLERPPLGRPRRALSRRPSAPARGRAANAAAPVAGPGRLYLIERCGGGLGLTAAEQEALVGGWSVVQLMERRPPAERARWIQDAAEQLVTAGVSSDIPVLVLVDAACGGPLTIETQLRSAHAVIDERGLADGAIMGGLMMVLGPIAAGPAPQVYAFAANGLAG